MLTCKFQFGVNIALSAAQGVDFTASKLCAHREEHRRRKRAKDFPSHILFLNGNVKRKRKCGKSTWETFPGWIPPRKGLAHIALPSRAQGLSHLCVPLHTNPWKRRLHPLRHISASHKVTNKSSSSTSQFGNMWSDRRKRKQMAMLLCPKQAAASGGSSLLICFLLLSTLLPPPLLFLSFYFSTGGFPPFRFISNFPLTDAQRDMESSAAAALLLLIFACLHSKHPAGSTLHLMRMLAFVWTLYFFSAYI